MLKWCDRVADDFDVSKSSTGNRVFQEALDCFAACLPRVEKRLPLAEAIGAKLNISKVKVSKDLLKQSAIGLPRDRKNREFGCSFFQTGETGSLA